MISLAVHATVAICLAVVACWFALASSAEEKPMPFLGFMVVFVLFGCIVGLVVHATEVFRHLGAL